MFLQALLHGHFSSHEAVQANPDLLVTAYLADGLRALEETDDCRRKLQPLYNLFGYVIDGIDVAQSVQQGDVMRSITITERASD
jgi:cyclophilin family peptidyl-prolyl cis-trans isomerase